MYLIPLRQSYFIWICVCNALHWKLLLPHLQVTENKCLAMLCLSYSHYFQVQNRYWFLFQTLMPKLAVSGCIRGRCHTEFKREQAACPGCFFWVIFSSHVLRQQSNAFETPFSFMEPKEIYSPIPQCVGFYQVPVWGWIHLVWGLL